MFNLLIYSKEKPNLNSENMLKVHLRILLTHDIDLLG